VRPELLPLECGAGRGGQLAELALYVAQLEISDTGCGTQLLVGRVLAQNHAQVENPLLGRDQPLGRRALEFAQGDGEGVARLAVVRAVRNLVRWSRAEFRDEPCRLAVSLRAKRRLLVLLAQQCEVGVTLGERCLQGDRARVADAVLDQKARTLKCANGSIEVAPARLDAAEIGEGFGE